MAGAGRRSHVSLPRGDAICVAVSDPGSVCWLKAVQQRLQATARTGQLGVVVRMWRDTHSNAPASGKLNHDLCCYSGKARCYLMSTDMLPHARRDQGGCARRRRKKERGARALRMGQGETVRMMMMRGDAHETQAESPECGWRGEKSETEAGERARGKISVGRMERRGRGEEM